MIFKQTATGTFAGNISGTGSLHKQGTGTLILGNDSNPYTGFTVVNDGILQVSKDGNFGAPTSSLLFDNGTLEVTESFTSAKNVIANNIAHFKIDSGKILNLSGKISGGSGAKALVAEGPGTLSLTNAANDYSGGTTLTGGGTVSVSADGTLGAAAEVLTFDYATLQATDTFTPARGITSNTNAHLKVDSAKTLTLSGKITGAGAVTAEGPGTIALTDTANDYSGGTTLTSGVYLKPCRRYPWCCGRSAYV